MKLKETAFSRNIKTGEASTPDWGAEVGQGEKKLMTVEGVSDILNGMLYYKIDNIDDIEAAIGKGNSNHKLSFYLVNSDDENEPKKISIVLASVFDSIKVNGEILDGQKMIMFMTKDEREENGENLNKHYQRRYLKFPDKATYKGEELNKECINAITEKLGCTQNGSWYVSDIKFIDESLCLTAYVVDKENPRTFKNKRERSKVFNYLKTQRELSILQPNNYSGDFHPVILYGPPGTGKTFKMQEEYISKFSDINCFVTTFHQAFSYEEFVEGLKPIMNTDEESSEIKYIIESGVFKKACIRAVQLAGYEDINHCLKDSFENRKEKFDKAISENKTVLLCIDEINRGNVAAIFGDLISLIETDKRLGVDEKTEMKVKLPYSKEGFGVPANLLIIGTMNTADRSIQLMDTALRRRFKFEELLPNYDKLNGDAKIILKNINARIRCLLNKDHQIGHACLMNAKTKCEIFRMLVKKIIPLLEEYFYNDTEKIRFVLHEEGKNDNTFYEIDDDATNSYKLFDDSDDKIFYKQRDKCKLLEKEIDSFLTNIVSLKNTIESINSCNKSLTKDNKSLKGSIETCNNQINGLRKKIETADITKYKLDYENKIYKINEKINDYEEAIKDNDKKLNVNKSEIEKYQSELIEKEKKRSDYENKCGVYLLNLLNNNE